MSVSKFYILLGGAVAIIAVFKAMGLTSQRMDKWTSFLLTSIIHETVTLVRGLCLFTIYQYYSRRKDESHLFHIWKYDHLFKMLAVIGLPWWHSGWESACQFRGHGFEPWSGRIPHAAEQLGLCTTAAEPVLWSPRATAAEARAPGAHAPQQERPPRRGVAPTCCNWRNPAHSNEDPAQPRMNEWMNK